MRYSDLSQIDQFQYSDYLDDYSEFETRASELDELDVYEDDTEDGRIDRLISEFQTNPLGAV